MRLLVTRPEPDASRTAATLAARGHAPIRAPMLSAAFLPPPSAIRPPAAILFTSVNAVRAVAAWPQEVLPRDVPALAVGQRTADEARAAGFSDTRSADGDSTALASLAAEILDPLAGPLLYPTLAVPSGDLAARLQAAGFTVNQIEAYRMIAATALPEATEAAIAGDAVDGVLLYSRRTAETFVALTTALKPHLAALAFYCLSAEVAIALDTGHIHIADEPNEASLLKLLEAGT
ncbi:uroporphyrinogen-III synthase [Kaistia soli DSM 19436]|uniref:Uroporphyrinogen-III synthase n=1 Tax=Kaistia soli DSM 19436 TaxID=1122133 RepID=A0A1M5CMD0_9HYPH|nr:uroporphyrinogen-III synthase [Kaistia soli]SHF55888.1 uroporphyrinogen-III synthase [Kaistia soli DSM 19436]